MTARVRVGSAWVDATPKVYVGGQWVTPVAVRQFKSGAFEAIWAALGLVVTPDVVSKGGTGFQQTGDVTATPDGAQGAVTYSWVRISGDTGINVTDASAQVVQFNAFVTQGQIINAQFRCTATDAATGATASDTVAVSFGTNT